MRQQQLNEMMLRNIDTEFRYTRVYSEIQSVNPEIMAAIAKVPREKFVPESLKPCAYENKPLPIGIDQTISRPYIVARETDLFCPNSNDITLDIYKRKRSMNTLLYALKSPDIQGYYRVP